MFPEQEILWFEERSLNYESLQDTVGRVAGALRELGVQAGDRVAVLQTNTPEVVATIFAATSLGAVFVPLNYRARQAELAHMLRVAGPKVLLGGDRYVELAKDVAREIPPAPSIVAIESPAEGMPHLPTLAEGVEPAFPEDVADD